MVTEPLTLLSDSYPNYFPVSSRQVVFENTSDARLSSNGLGLSPRPVRVRSMAGISPTS